MAEIAYVLVSQSGSVSIRSRGRAFPRGKRVRVNDPADIEYFKTDRQFDVLEIPVERRKASKKDETEPDADGKKAEGKKPATKRSDKKSGKR